MPKGTVVTATFGTATSNGWPNTDTGQAWTTFGSGGTITAADYNAAGGFGTMSVPQANAFRAGRLATFSEADVDIACTFKVSRSPIAGASVEPGNLMLRGTSITSYYLFRVLIQTNGTVAAVIFDPSNNLIGSVTIPGLTYTGTSQLIRVRAQAIGQILRVKVWDTANSEPVGWPLTVIDDAYTGAGWVGVRCGVTFGNTNTTPVVFSIDNFTSVRVPDFAHDKVPLQVLAAFGADLTADWTTWTWTDITTDVQQANGQGITISPMGRSDGFSQAQPAGCAFTLKNMAGDYTANSATSKYYPNVRLNTPVWVLIGPATRFFGYANGFSPVWDASGRASLVSVSASGDLRRLNQGKAKLRSAVYRAITTASTLPTEYWSCEDGADGLAVTSATNAIAGGAEMLALGASSFAASDGAPGSDKQPTFGAGGRLQGAVRGAISVSSWRIQCLVKVNAIASPDFAVPIEWDTADGSGWELLASADADGGLGYSDTFGNSFSSTVGIDDGLWHELRVTASQSGSNVALNVFLDGVAVISRTLTSTTLSRITNVYSNRGGSVSNVIASVGHFAVWNDTTTVSGLDTVDAMRGHAGELATARLTRLCAEQGEQITVSGTTDVAMGPQRVDTLINLLRECEAADLGVLYDGVSNGLAYVTHRQRENAAASLTVDAAQAQLGQPFGPADDDQRNRNLWTVSRVNGGAPGVFQDVTGPLGTAAIGTYDDSTTLNIASDQPLASYASWLVHLGTVVGFRYPAMALNFRRSPALALAWLAAPLQGRVDVTNISSILKQHPAGTVSLLVEGYTESFNETAWSAQSNCSPYDPWRIAAYAADTGDTGEFVGRYDTDGSTLSSSALVGATSLSLATTAGGRLWTTLADDFPLFVGVAGIKVKVTNITGASSPQTATVDGSTVTKALASGSAVSVWNPPVVGL